MHQIDLILGVFVESPLLDPACQLCISVPERLLQSLTSFGIVLGDE